MKKLFFLLVMSGLLTSCGAKKFTAKNDASQKAILLEGAGPKEVNLSSTTQNKPFKIKSPRRKVTKIINYAMGFLGTDYKWGGTTKRGVDCSGLIYISFLNAADIILPRTSRQMAELGKEILKDEVRMGDLLFFKTGGSSIINHVALVVGVDHGVIRFIQATSSGGVIVSTLQQRYWKNAFFEARRVL